MIRTPFRPPADPLWSGRHFFWPGCDCCADDVYFGTSWHKLRLTGGLIEQDGGRYDLVNWLARRDGAFQQAAEPSNSGSWTKSVECLRCDAAGNVYGLAVANWLYRFDVGRQEVWRVKGGRGCEVLSDGTVWTANPDTTFATLLEYDAASGALIAEHAVDGIVEGDHSITQIAAAADGTWRLGHVTHSGGTTDEGAFGPYSVVGKYDAALNHVWDSAGFDTLFNFAGFWRRDLALNEDGDVLVPTLSGTRQLVLDDGTNDWSAVSDLNYGACSDDAGNWYITSGYTSGGTRHMQIEKLDSSGASQWTARLGPDDRVHVALAWAAGVVYATGSYWASVSDATAWALDAGDGSVIWSTALGYSGTGVAARPGRCPIWP